MKLFTNKLKTHRIISLILLSAVFNCASIFAFQKPTDSQRPDIGVQLVSKPKPPKGKEANGMEIIGQTSIELPATSWDKESIKTGLEALLTENPKLLGLDSAPELRLDYVKVINGRSGLTKTAYAHFVQQWDGVDVEGSRITLTLKLLNDKTVIVNQKINIFPELDKKNRPKSLSKSNSKSKVKSQINKKFKDEEIRDVGQKVRWIKNKWRVMNDFAISKTGAAASVDESGDVIVWDARHYFDYQGQVEGRVILFDPKTTGDALTSVRLKDLKVNFPQTFSSVFTNESGRFSFSSNLNPLNIHGEMMGKWVHVVDIANSPHQINQAIERDVLNQITFNPVGNEELKTAQVNAYYHTTFIHDWLTERGFAEENFIMEEDPRGIHSSIKSWVNVPGSCNAGYATHDDHIEYLRGGNGCPNMAFDTVIYHEYAHFIDNKVGQIEGWDGLSEGWGDLIAVLATGQPLIGEGAVGVTRSADNNYIYNPANEIHLNGNAWSGFGWELRKKLIDRYGELIGVPLAEDLLLAVMWDNPRSIPEAMEAVLVRDDDDGDLSNGTPHQNEILDAAMSKGVDIASGFLVSSIEPRYVPIYEKSPLLIKGKGLSDVTEIFVGTIAVTAVYPYSDEKMFVIIPPYTGEYDIPENYKDTFEVPMTLKHSSGQLRGGIIFYTKRSLPKINYFNPIFGPVGGGTEVEVSGENFRTDSIFSLGDTPVNFEFISSERIRFITPPMSESGHKPLKIKNSSFAIYSTEVDLLEFLYTAPVAIHSAEPNHGSVVGGTTVTLRGENFHRDMAVVMSGINNIRIRYFNSSEIQFVTPAGVAGPNDISISGIGIEHPYPILKDGFIYENKEDPDAPTIVTMDPSTGTVFGGEEIILTGANLDQVTIVRFNGVDVPSFEQISNTKLKVVTPPYFYFGEVNVAILNSDISQFEKSNGFSYVNPDPVFNSITPSSGPTAGGTFVTIKGNHFLVNAKVFFGLYELEDVKVIDRQTMTGRTPQVEGTPHDQNSLHNIQVRNPDYKYINNGQFEYFPSNPYLELISPSAGSPAGGTWVRITGARFDPLATVQIGGISPTNYIVESSTSLRLLTPPHAEGTVEIIITNPNGEKTPVLFRRVFTYTDTNQPPTIRGEAIYHFGNDPIYIRVLDNDNDPEEKPLRVVSITNPKYGTAKLITPFNIGYIEYTPAADNKEMDTFQYSVVDDLGATTSGTVYIYREEGPENPFINHIPEADDGIFSTNVNESLEISLPMGDADGDPLRVILNDPMNGSLLGEQDKSGFYNAESINYVPRENFTGTDQFTYRVYDGMVFSAWNTITVHVNNAMPFPEPSPTPTSSPTPTPTSSPTPTPTPSPTPTNTFTLETVYSQVGLVDQEMDLTAVVKDEMTGEKLSDRDISVYWYFNSGPGKAMFSNDRSLHTRVRFNNSGSFTVTVRIVRGAIQKERTVRIQMQYPSGFLTESSFLLPSNRIVQNNQAAEMKFQLNQAGSVKVIVRNILSGEEIEELFNDYFLAGVHVKDWKAEGLSSGSYLVEFYRDGQLIHREKFVVIR